MLRGLDLRARRSARRVRDPAARRAGGAGRVAGRARAGRSGTVARRTQPATRDENARHGAEDEMIRLATAEQKLADALSDRERLSTLAELTAGDGAIGRLTARARGEETRRSGGSAYASPTSVPASTCRSRPRRDALVERDEALAARNAAEAVREAEKATADRGARRRRRGGADL